MNEKSTGHLLECSRNRGHSWEEEEEMRQTSKGNVFLLGGILSSDDFSGRVPSNHVLNKTT